MRRLLLFVLAALALAGCSGSPDADQSDRATAVAGGSPAAQAPEAPTGAPAAGATSGPTSGAASAATITPATVPTVAPGTVSERARQEYNTLIMLKAAADLLGEAARPRPTPASAETVETGIATLLKAAGDKLRQEASDPSLEAAWPKARETHGRLLELHGRWADKQVAAADLAGELEPVQKQLDEVLDAAEDGVASRYGVDAAELRQHRQEAVQSLAGRFVAPAP